jgi:hypothetical protein
MNSKSILGAALVGVGIAGAANAAEILECNQGQSTSGKEEEP